MYPPRRAKLTAQYSCVREHVIFVIFAPMARGRRGETRSFTGVVEGGFLSPAGKVGEQPSGISGGISGGAFFLLARAGCG